MLWVKVFHILFVMAWMAGLFYLPRILVHYVEGTQANEDTRRLVIMANKLFGFSTMMAILAVGLGFVLWFYFGIGGAWMEAKLSLVLLLVAYQYQTLRYIREMRAGNQLHTSLFFRIYNEAALVIVVPILILVELKPF